MASSFRSLFSGFDPDRDKSGVIDPAVGRLTGSFEPFVANPKFDFATRNKPTALHVYPLIVPVTPPLYDPISQSLQRLIDSTWKRAEPAKGAMRGAIQIGRAGISSAPVAQPGYSPHVKPVAHINDGKGGDPNVPPVPSPAAIADDWKTFKQIKRTNALTFRGDSRGPVEVIGNQGGFFPPSSRTDRFYLEGPIYDHFASYLKRRYDRDITKAAFLGAIDQVMSTPESRKILVDYMMWRKVVDGEAMHLGRMVVQECLKGYISTSRSLFKSLNFALKDGQRDGWIYVTMVRGGFLVPPNTSNWGTHEQEVANWGPILADDIMAFRYFTAASVGTGPIYVRPFFRKKEPKAFEKIFNMLSGWVPKSL